MTYDLKIIKKKYGEQMMHLCREIFPKILEEPGLLSKLLLEHFDNNKLLYNDIIDNNLEEEFKNYIYGFIDVEKDKKEIIIKSPKELLQDAGYTLYECRTEEDIQLFKKYYFKEEELCTFRGGRLNRCFVFFAVKNDVEKIKRENFKKPTRQDEYGTSVISIQFTKDDSHTLSIKNRYNHTVNNPDATFSNNLDNIINGLTQSFENYYGLIQKNKNNSLDIPGYVLANDGKYYKYNYEIENIYYCTNNVIIDNFEVKKYPKEEYIVLDYFLIDLKNKTIKLYDESIQDSFPESFENISKIRIEYQEKLNKRIIITPNIGEDIIIEIDNLNRIVSLTNKNIESIENYFLYLNENLTNINIPKLKKVGNYFLHWNKKLTTLNVPDLQEVGDEFLYDNEILITINIPNLQKTGNNFLKCNKCLTTLSIPKLKKVGDNFLIDNTVLTILNVPNLQKVEDNFLFCNRVLTLLNIINLQEVGNNFLYKNQVLKTLNTPNLQKVGNNFLVSNEVLKTLNIISLKGAGNNFLKYNKVLTTLNVPNLQEVGVFFLNCNRVLTNLNAPSLFKELLEMNINKKL